MRIALLYAVFAGLWILLSDHLLSALVADRTAIAWWATIKGWGFVAATAGLLYAERRWAGRSVALHEMSRAALAESRERLAMALNAADNLPDSYVYHYTRNADGVPQFLYLSAGVERLHGVKAQEALRDAGVLHGQMAPEQLPAFLAAEAASLRTLTDFQMEVRMRRADGQWRWLQVRSRPRRKPDGQVLWDGVATDITARKEAEAASQTAEQRLADIIEFLPDATFVIDQDKRIIAWNRACEIMTGVKKQALLGQGDYAYAEPFFGERQPILIDLLDLPAPELEAIYKCVQRKGHKIYAESFIPRLNGGEGAHLWGVASPLFDREGRRCGAIEVVRDVTEQKRMEQASRESERRYRELVEHANSIILRWGRDGRITFLNEFGQRFFGYTQTEICGRHVMGTIVPETEDCGRSLRTLMDDVCADPLAYEQNINENMRRSGERVWIAWTNKVVLDERGQVVEILSIGADITARKRAEEELRATQAGLEQRVIDRTAELAVAKERAEQADHVKSAFLASMSHELRTPLNSIIGFTGILLQGLAGPTNEEQTKQLGMVRSSARHLLSLINDVLDLSKIEAGQLHVSLEPVVMSDVIHSVVTALMPLAREKSLALEADIAPDVGAVISDRRRVKQVLINLAGNAVKFTDKGHVRIECRIEGGCVVTSVVDSGIGISPEDIGRLFQMFQQIPDGQPRNQGGTGLGLSISKKLVEMLGGRIRVESVSGVGSTFSFTLPLDKGDRHEIDGTPH